ncbi:unnamed protein product [Callosobruchus maculatus]|uniref:Uncharacterized protein n=1 Tax=Callosobruchus maculatus TaxID=64391 RepID=A0A653CER6_CALMS|nr:unnamed protein product [Callosobruchus maculatus]
MIEQTQELKYLETKIQSNGRHQGDLNGRIDAAARMLKMIPQPVLLPKLKKSVNPDLPLALSD